MTTFSLPSLAPTEFDLVAFDGALEFPASPLTGAFQSTASNAARWDFLATWRNLSADDEATLRAFVLKLQGLTHRMSVPIPGYTRRGAGGGTPLVNGATQTGSSLVIDGASASVTNWIREGDFFSVGSRLLCATADANSDGSGNVTVSFWPPLAPGRSPADGAAVEIDSPAGVFALADRRTTFPRRVGRADGSPVGTIQIAGIEDVLA